MDLVSQDVHTYVETWQGLRDIPRFTKRAMESLIPTDGLSSSFTPCSAALHPDIMLRDKYYTASDQNIIVWIPNIIYCSTRDIRGTIWSSNTPLTSGVCLPREILTERLLYLLYFSTHIWGKGDVPLPSGGQKEKTYWEENPWIFHHHSQYCNILVPRAVSYRPHQAYGCDISTSMLSLDKETRGHAPPSHFDLALQPKVRGKRAGWHLWTGYEERPPPPGAFCPKEPLF